MTDQQKFNLAQARQMIEYNSKRIQMIREEIERVGYDIRMLQMQIRGMRGDQVDAEKGKDSHYY